MSTIERHSDWCSIDRLGGEALTDGEKLIIKWPDGTYEQVTIIVHRGDYPCGGLKSHAFIKGEYRKIPIEIPIVGLEAQRV